MALGAWSVVGMCVAAAGVLALALSAIVMRRIWWR
jgi:hypothetical protein